MKTKKRLVILTGSGISAESGLKTFREMGGLWETHDVTEVATPEAWARDPELVLRFYNERRKALYEAEPNPGHFGLVDLESDFDVHIVTQNVDDLHERAGSSQVLHLHGELGKARSTIDPDRVYDIDGWELNMGDVCEKGSQLRPHIVWFGEPVPLIQEGVWETEKADVFAVVGTSLQVYPAASLLQYVPPGVPIFVVDPHELPIQESDRITIIQKPASTGVSEMAEMIRALA